MTERKHQVKNSKPKLSSRPKEAPVVEVNKLVPEDADKIWKDMLVETFLAATLSPCSGKVMYDHGRNKTFMKVQAFLSERGMIDDSLMARKVNAAK